MKKVLVCLSFLCALTVLLSSCGIITLNVGKETADTETDETTASADDTDGDTETKYRKYESESLKENSYSALEGADSFDLGGQSVFIASATETGDFFNETEGIYSASVYERNRKVEAKYNGKIVMSYLPSDEILSQMKAAKKSGDIYTDFASVPQGETASYIYAGVAGSINSLPYFSIDTPGVNAEATEMLNFGIKLYGVICDAASSPEAVSCVFVNLDMLDGNAVDYDSVFEGGFTYEKYSELVKNASLCSSLDDGELYTSVYFGMGGYYTNESKKAAYPDNISGITDMIKGFVSCIAPSVEISESELKAEDTTTAAPETEAEETSEAETESTETAAETTAETEKTEITLDGFDLFRYGKAGVAVGTLGDARKLGQAGFRWEILPMPKAGEEQSEYVSYASLTSAVIIPSTFTDNIDAMSYVLTGLCISSDGWMQEDLINDLQKNYISGVRTLDMAELILSNVKYDTASLLSGYTNVYKVSYGTLIKSVTENSKYSELVSSYTKKYNSVISSLK